MRHLLVTIVFAALPTVFACSKTDSEVTPTTTATATAAAPDAAPSASAAPTKTVPHVELAIETVANTMLYNKTTLTVPAGAVVHLILKNNATMTTLPHNWVLVKPGTEASVALAAQKYGEPAGYINSLDTNMIEHTPLSKPGESAEVTFTAPAPGAYPYICTVPGHYMLMKGVFTVTPPSDD